MLKFPFNIVKEPVVTYLHLTGMVSEYAHHRGFVLEDRDKEIVIWTTVHVKDIKNCGSSYNYCSSYKQAVKLLYTNMHRTWTDFNFPPKFPAELYDYDFTMMSTEEVLQFFLKFEYFNVSDIRGEFQ